MVDSDASTFGKLAQLYSVWWMDVSATFHGVAPGRYKIQWRLQVTSEAPVVNTEFRVVLFDQHEVTAKTTTTPLSGKRTLIVTGEQPSRYRPSKTKENMIENGVH